jgi:dTDP-glucose 4,6-dehydratase
MARALVTGGAGFLGSHLCDLLITEGHEVLCLDNLLTGRLQNIEHLMPQGRFSFIQHDVTRPIEIEGPLDYILDFASPASPKDYAKHPIHTLKVGALGTYHALGLAKAKGAVFLVASSSEVYGDPEVNPQPESYWGHVNPVGPRSVYDEAKRYAEAITMAYHHVHQLEVRIARIFNTYGPRMRLNDGRALPSFMTQALGGESLTVYGDGSHTRSFCYVSDLVGGIYRLLLSDENAPVNLGNPDEVTILQLAREVIEVTGSRSGIIFQPLPQDDPKVRRPDISKAKHCLAWEPRVSRLDGLKQTVPYFRASLSKTQGVGS